MMQLLMLRTKQITAGLEAESIILKGNPAEKILDFADEHEIDMIVVGSLGKSGVERFAIGAYPKKLSGMQRFRSWLSGDGGNKKNTVL